MTSLEQSLSDDRSWEDLSVQEQQTINDLIANIEKKPETCSFAKENKEVIKNALIKNPAFLENAMKLQLMGAELVVTDFQPDQYIKFADAARNLKIEEQEKALKQLTEDEINTAIAKILQPLSTNVHEDAKRWLRETLQRSDNDKGLNWVEGLVLAVHHGGTIITTKQYGAMAKSNPNVYEDKLSSTWYLVKSLTQVMEDKQHVVPYGFRKNKEVVRYDTYAANRGRGVRIADILVILA